MEWLNSKNQLTFEDYLFCLPNQRAQRTDDFRITSKCQQIFSNSMRTIALSGLMDKRYVLDCGIHTVPFSFDNISGCYEPECNWRIIYIFIMHYMFIFIINHNILTLYRNIFTIFLSKTVLCCPLFVLFFLSEFFVCLIVC